jgi:hypothetical protein
MGKNLNVLITVVVMSLTGLAFWNCSKSGDNGGGGDTTAGTINFSLSVPPVSVAAGAEQTVCATLAVNNANAIFIRRIRLHSDAGIAQTIVYKASPGELASAPAPCTVLDAIQTHHPLAVSLSSDMDLQFPAASSGPVGIELAANQMVRVEVHFYNATAAALNAGATLTLDATSVPAGAVHADLFLGGTTAISIPAASSSTVAGGFMPVYPSGTFLFAVQTQEWRTGTGVKVYAAASAADTSNLIFTDTTGFAAGVKVFSTPVDMNAKGVKYECSYNNPGVSVRTFGPSVVTDETCFVWQYYYPAAGFKGCVDSACFTLP